MLRMRIAKLVVFAFWLVVAFAINAALTALVQWAITSGGSFWPLFLCIAALQVVLAKRRVG